MSMLITDNPIGGDGPTTYLTRDLLVPSGGSTCPQKFALTTVIVVNCSTVSTLCLKRERRTARYNVLFILGQSWNYSDREDAQKGRATCGIRRRDGAGTERAKGKRAGCAQ
eukprot:6095777-Pyramimonas_sp.AAC.3